MRTFFRLFLCLIAVSGAACASSTDTRLNRLEAQSQSLHVLDLRMAHVEERLTGVEAAVGDLRDREAGGKGKVTGPPPAKETSYRLPSSPSRRGEARAAAEPVPAGSVPVHAPVPPAPLGVPVTPNAATVVRADSGGAPASSSAPQAPSLQPLPVAGKPVSPAKAQAAPGGATSAPAYDAALALYYKGEYAKAQQDFAAFLERHPNHRLAPNALYWQGECRYSLGDFGGSVLLFKDVAAKYPKHSKAPDALLKAGYAYDRLNDKENAEFYWQILLDDYPKSKAAALARKRMANR